MMKKIENLLKTSYARITTSEEPNEKKWVFSSVPVSYTHLTLPTKLEV